MIGQNKVKTRLKQGENLTGTFIRISDPAIVEVVALAGFDFIVIDNEHTAMGRESLVNLIRTAELWGITPIVRVREKNTAEMLQALDSGAMGVQVPQVDTAAEAQAVVDAVKYSPQGKRGFASSQRSAGYGHLGGAQYSLLSNEQTLTICYCETAQSVENLEQIVRVEGVDLIFIGPNDLSQAYGVTGQLTHPKVTQSIDYIIQTAQKAGKAVGIIAASAAEVREWNGRGAQFVCLSSDLGMVASRAKNFIEEIHASV